MTRATACLLSITSLSFILCACSFFDKENTKAALCNRIKADLMFNGNTNITSRSNVQNTERQRLQQAYNDNHC